jgi:multidrug efflux pump subunit AcrA (membrane-fusion protein)
MSPRIRYVSLLVAFAALGSAACASGCHKTSQAQEAQGPQPPPGEAWLTAQQVRDAKIEYSPIDLQNVDDTILTSGKVTFDDQKVVHIYSPVSGRVTRIDATLGQSVKKGQPLAVIESPDVGIASSDVGKAKADLIAAEHDYSRQKELFDAHAASQKDVESSEDNYRKAKAELDRAKQKAFLFRAGSGDVSQGYTVIAPMEGEVIMKNVSSGIEVQGQYGGGSALELFTVGELDRVWVIADVFEMDIARVKVGSKALVKVVAYSGKGATARWTGSAGRSIRSRARPRSGARSTTPTASSNRRCTRRCRSRSRSVRRSPSRAARCFASVSRRWCSCKRAPRRTGA